MDNYTVIHLHDDTSNANGYGDSCTKYTEYIKLAKQQGMKAIAFSNHGGIYDWVKKKQECDKNGIKYIHGVELYLCINLEDNTRGYHIGLYSKNWEGVMELNTLMSRSTSKGVKDDKSDRHFYFVPRISFDELMNTSDNIIVTTACLASPLWKLSDSENENYEYNAKKRDELLSWMSNNKHRCFLEIQYHNHPHQIKFNQMLHKWSSEYNIPLIVGTDTHSSNQYKAECRKIFQKATDSFYGEEDSFDLTWKTYDELIEAFKTQSSLPMDVVIQAINNTNVFSNMVEEFTLDKSFKYPTLYGKNATKTWRQRILDMYDDKLKRGIISKEKEHLYKEQINEEFKVMTKLGMESFMLFMSELQCWCRENKIYSSPCRGSVGGSTIAFITDIITVDPIIWKTVFSRFCNEDRVSLGDIDEDYSPKDRVKVYQYIIDRFGNKNVAYILTLGTVQDRGSIDYLAKGLGYKDLNKVKIIKNKFDEYFKSFEKIVQEEVNIEELEGATSSSPTFDDCNLYVSKISVKSKAEKLKELKKSWDILREENKDLFYYFDGIKGTYKSKGNHASGMIGSPITLHDNLGVFYKNGDENFPVSFCAMKSVDSLNYVKFDILGLKTIGILQDTYKLIGKEWEEDNTINWNDELVWNDMITCPSGVFQFEGNYAFDLLKQFKPRAINDMSLVNASLRPSGKSYRDRLINREFNNNPSELIDNLLKPNNGFLVFQEDTIAFLQEICGMSGSEADTTRRAIGKKDEELLKAQLPKILEGYCKCSNKPREESEKEAKEFVQIVQDSSEYQFGYNHSTGYSMNGYKCARLRYYYPLEFTTAYFNNAENDDDVLFGMELAKSKNIKVLSCKFGYSKGGYFFNKETNSIYKGVGSIKNLNETVGNELYELSKTKKYNNFLDLLLDIQEKTSCNSRQLEILIKLDYFDMYAKSNKLISFYKYFQLLYDKKAPKKATIERDILDANMIKHIESNSQPTASTYGKLDWYKSLAGIWLDLHDCDMNFTDKLSFQSEIVGYIDYKNENLDKRYVLITTINTKYTPVVDTYCLNNGSTCKCKINKRVWGNKPIQQNEVIYINKMTKKFGCKKVGEDEKGKPIFEEDKSTLVWWIDDYTIVNINEVLNEK